MDAGITSVRDLEGGVTVVDVNKDMDFLTSKEVKDTFIREMNQGKRKVIANLSRVTLIDSSGLEALASAQMKARAMEINFCIVCNNSTIRKIMGTTGLDGFLRIYNTEKDAVLDLAAAG